MVQQYGKQVAEEIIEYSYNISTDPTKETMPPRLSNDLAIQHKIKQYNETMRRLHSNQRIIPPNVNKYSAEYAKIIAAKPRATSSANIRLGGVY